MPGTQSGRLRFGVFEVDLCSEELFKHGRKVKLRSQAFQTLALLLEHPGTVVTRAQLRERLWPSDTFVDFDLGLNSAVKRLRDALHDSADKPRFVETLPRRGYRFIAPVENVPISRAEDGGLSEADKATEPPAAGQTHAPPAWEQPSRQVVESARRHWLRWVATAAASVSVVLAIQGFMWWRRPIPSTAASIRALAVLPLENNSGDPGQEYFADGMTEAIINNLAQISSLKVISQTSVMPYKEKRKPLPEIARELNVDAVVEGAVILAGERVRIDVRLFEAATERPLWGQSYERNIIEVTSLQNDTARGIANEIRAVLTPEERARLERKASVDPETSELYMKGRYFWEKRTDDSLRRSIEYFEAAIQKRPDYALAYAAMAEAYVVRTDIPPQEVFSKAKAAARAALMIDDTIPEAHNALALSLFEGDWDWAGARREFERALALNPNYFWAHLWYSRYQHALGWKNWSAEAKRAGELDPLSLVGPLGGWYLQSGEYDKAIALDRKKLELDPNKASLYFALGNVYALKGMYGDALQNYQRGMALPGGTPGPLGWLGYTYGLAGQRAEAETILTQLEQVSQRRYFSQLARARVYVGLGDKDQAFYWLKEAVAKHDPDIVMLNIMPEFSTLRADPRFAELQRAIGLPQ